MHDRLVGRTAELSTLLRAVDETYGGVGSTVVVAGDPGIGKTFLLGVLRREAEARGARVLTGRASEFESLPMGAIVHALDDHLRTVAPALLEALGRDTVAELSLMFPALRMHGSRRLPAASADDRVRGYVATRSLLGRLAEDRPLVLVLDDLHWADRGTLELFAYLMRRPPQAAVLLVGSYRPYEIDTDVAADVARTMTDGRTRYVELAPLGPEDAADLTGVGDDREALALLQASGGNPFFLLELSRAGVGALSTEQALPPTIARAVSDDLDRASPAARDFAEAAAVVGDPFDLDLVIHAAGLDDDAGYAAVDDLAHRGVVLTSDLPRRFIFRHPLVRQAIYDGLPPGRRLTLHERCIEGLGARAAPAQELAQHLQHAARPGDGVAVEVLTTAARAAAARAPGSAVQWLRAAARLLPGDADRRARLAVVQPLPGLLSSLGDLEGAHAAAVEALGLTDDPHDRVGLNLSCVNLEHARGLYDVAHQRLASTLKALPGQRGEDAVLVMIAMVMDAFYVQDSASMVSWTQRAVDEAERLGSSGLIAAAHAGGALTHALAGRTREAEAHLEAALEILPTLTDAELTERLDVLAGITGAELYLDRYEACVEHGERGIALGRAAGNLASAPALLPSYGSALWVIGRLDDAARHFDAGLEAALAARLPQSIAWTHFNLAYVLLVSGDVDGALAHSRASLTLAERHDESIIQSWAGTIVGLALIEAGDPAGALQALHRAGGGPTIPNIPGGWRTHALEGVARSYLALDDVEAAEQTAAFAREWSAEVDLPYGRSMALRATAACLYARGSFDEAAVTALAAAESADAPAARVDAARSRILAGRALIEAGRQDEALPLLQRAAAFLDSCGAIRSRDEAERELGRLGARPHRRTTRGTTTSGLPSLTAREREIADLVARRHTNNEIAETMFLSTKTVETHLRNTFRKLGVTSRTEVARLIEAEKSGEPEPAG